MLFNSYGELKRYTLHFYVNKCPADIMAANESKRNAYISGVLLPPKNIWSVVLMEPKSWLGYGEDDDDFDDDSDEDLDGDEEDVDDDDEDDDNSDDDEGSDEEGFGE